MNTTPPTAELPSPPPELRSLNRQPSTINSLPLPNPRHEAFAQAVASGQSGADAYVTVYGQPRRHAAAVGGSRLLKNPGVAARVRSLQSAAAQNVTLNLQQLLHFLTRVIITPISEVSASSDLCHRIKDTADGTDLAMPNKLAAVALAAKLQGFFRHPVNNTPSIDPQPSTLNGFNDPPSINNQPSTFFPPILTEEKRQILMAAKRASILANLANSVNSANESH